MMDELTDKYLIDRLNTEGGMRMADLETEASYGTLFQTIRAIIEEQVKESWALRPMETAPKDGTEFCAQTSTGDYILLAWENDVLVDDDANVWPNYLLRGWLLLPKIGG